MSGRNRKTGNGESGGIQAGEKRTKQTTLSSFFNQNKTEKEENGSGEPDPPLHQIPSEQPKANWGALIEKKRRWDEAIGTSRGHTHADGNSQLLGRRSYGKNYVNKFQDNRPPGVGSGGVMDGIRCGGWWSRAGGDYRESGHGRPYEGSNMGIILSVAINSSSTRHLLDESELSTAAAILSLSPPALSLFSELFYANGRTTIRWTRSCSLPFATFPSFSESLEEIRQAGLCVVARTWMNGDERNQGGRAPLLTVEEEIELSSQLLQRDLRLLANSGGARNGINYSNTYRSGSPSTNNTPANFERKSSLGNSKDTKGAVLSVLALRIREGGQYSMAKKTQTTPKKMRGGSGGRGGRGAGAGTGSGGYPGGSDRPEWRVKLHEMIGLCLALDTEKAEHVLRMHRAVLISSGYNPDEAATLLKQPISELRFPYSHVLPSLVPQKFLSLPNVLPKDSNEEDVPSTNEIEVMEDDVLENGCVSDDSPAALSFLDPATNTKEMNEIECDIDEEQIDVSLGMSDSNAAVVSFDENFEECESAVDTKEEKGELCTLDATGQVDSAVVTQSNSSVSGRKDDRLSQDVGSSPPAAITLSKYEPDSAASVNPPASTEAEQLRNFVFPTRYSLLEYENALAASDTMETAVVKGDSTVAYEILHTASDVILDAPPLNSTSNLTSQSHGGANAMSVWITAVVRGVGLLEREKRYGEALHYIGIVLRWAGRVLERVDGCPPPPGVDLAPLPCGSVILGELWLRYAKDLDHTGRKRDSLCAYEAGSRDPHVFGAQRVSMQRAIVRLSVPPLRWTRPSFPLLDGFNERKVYGVREDNGAGGSVWVLGDGRTGSVEDVALFWYLKNTNKPPGVNGMWRGMHGENGPFLTLYAILLWDILFPSVYPGVPYFQTPMQDIPTCLAKGLMRNESMVALVEERCKELSDREGGVCRAVELIRKAHAEFFGVQCAGVNWKRMTEDELVQYAIGLGPLALGGMCRLFSEGWEQWMGGVPDLCMWVEGSDVIGQGRGGAKLVEVKGPGDRLSDRQIAMLGQLMRWGVDVEVCYVVLSE